MGKWEKDREKRDVEDERDAEVLFLLLYKQFIVSYAIFNKLLLLKEFVR